MSDSAAGRYDNTDVYYYRYGKDRVSEGWAILSTPFRLEVPRRLYEELVAQAVAELPNECCGVLAGTVAGGVGRVTQRYPLVNAAASPVEFESEPASLLSAWNDINRQKLEVLAVYHSHPMSEPVPSRKDLARSWSPDVVNFILSLLHSPPMVRGWWLTDEGYQGAEWTIQET